MKIKVSSIKNRALRRAAIVASYPLLFASVFPAVAWNAVLDAIAWQVDLARSAAREWRK